MGSSTPSLSHRLNIDDVEGPICSNVIRLKTAQVSMLSSLSPGQHVFQGVDLPRSAQKTLHSGHQSFVSLLLLTHSARSLSFLCLYPVPSEHRLSKMLHFL